MSQEEAEPLSPEASRGYDAATEAGFVTSLRRIERAIPLLGGAIAVILGFSVAWTSAAGFAAGSAVAFLNFRWLERTVTVLTNVVSRGDEHAAKPSVVFRFLFRFVLIAVGAYVIFVSYPTAFHGFLAGLFVPVLAILLEAIYGLFAGLRRGNI